MSSDDPLLEDITFLKGRWTPTEPVVVIDADFARKAIASGELALFVWQALEALESSTKTVIVLAEHKDTE
jgi:hypothetical protein